MKKRDYKIIEETEFAIVLLYNGRECGFARDYYNSIDEFLDEVDRSNEQDKKDKEAEKKRRASLTDAERKAEDEYRKSLYERMQSEQEVMFGDDDE